MSLVYLNLPIPMWWTRFETRFNRFDPKSDAIWANYAKDLAGLKRFMIDHQLNKIEAWQGNRMASHITELLVCVPVVIKLNRYDLHLIHGVEGDGSYEKSTFYIRHPFPGRGNARIWKTWKSPLSYYESQGKNQIQYIIYNEKIYEECKEKQKRIVA
jgi:hypothetical protein